MSSEPVASLWIYALLLAVVALLGLAIWSIKRHKDPHLSLDTDLPIDTLVASLSGISLGMAIEGNAVEVVENGAFFDRLLEDIARAAHTVHFETFLWKDGRLGRRMADAFSERARAGAGRGLNGGTAYSEHSGGRPSRAARGRHSSGRLAARRLGRGKNLRSRARTGTRQKKGGGNRRPNPFPWIAQELLPEHLLPIRP